MVTFAEAQALRIAAIETAIAKAATEEVASGKSANIDRLWRLRTDTMGGGSSSGAGLSQTDTTDAFADALTSAALSTSANQDSLLTRLGGISDPPSENNGAIALLKTILAQLRDDRSFDYWTDDDDAIWIRSSSFDEAAGEWVFSNLSLDGSGPFTPGANARPAGLKEQDADKDPQTEPVIYDTATTTDNLGWSVIVFDHGTSPSTITSQGVLAGDLTPVADATNVRPLPVEKATYWQYVEGETLTVSGDSSANTTLTIPTALSAIADEDLQVSISINPNEDVLNASLGLAVAGLNQATALALMADTLRFGFGTTLSFVEGERLSPGHELLTITGRPNITAFECHSTSADFLPTLNVKWARRSS